MARTPLSRERVLNAALTYADQHGIESLSMRKLGDLLEVEAMSLYRHVSNKDAILDGLVEVIAARFAPPAPGKTWKKQLRQRCITTHEVLMAHPWATMLVVSRANTGPNMLHYVDATIGCLLSAGFSIPMADYAWNTLDSYVYGFTLSKLNFPFKPEEYADAARGFLPMIPQDTYPHLVTMAQSVIDGEHDGLHNFEFGLDLLLDSLSRLHRKHTP